MQRFLTKYQWFYFSIFYWSTSLFILFYFNGTGGEADSINHYLYAKYAPQHPSLYLNHWAKPVFTLLASPFARFGFTGVKLFNVLCAYGASYFVFKLAQQLKFPKPALASLFYFIFPISFVTTFSGLTEPLCALVLLAAIFLFNKKHYLFAATLISLSPFIRSEGLIFLGIFALFILGKKNWKAFFMLSFGHLIYTLVGYYHYQDILWVFTKIPYATLNSHYGGGELFHFAEKLNYLMGIPLLILFSLGTLRFIFTYKRQTDAWKLSVFLFITFFIAHSLFWYLEVFNSMGLKRVFAAVTPLMALLALSGYNLIHQIQWHKLRVVLSVFALVVILIFPFTRNPAAIDWKDLNLTEAQKNAIKVGAFLKKQKLQNSRFIYTDPYLSEVLEIDPFDFKAHQTLALNCSPIPLKELIVIHNYRFNYIDSVTRKVLSTELYKNDIVIWDNWHSVVDYGVLDTHLEGLSILAIFEEGRSIYKIYQR